MDAFDADVLIYAARDGHELGRRVRALFQPASDESTTAGIGSVLLIPEVLRRPMGLGQLSERRRLGWLLARLDLLPVEHHTAEVATTLAAKHGLRTVDATHLATAVLAGADRFITNNTKDFRPSITEIEIVHPTDLPDP